MMLTKKEQRLRRARQTRIRIGKQDVVRLSVNRTNTHIYATLVSVDGATVLASASTVEASVRASLGGSCKGATTAAATAIGTRIAEKAKAAGVERVAFDVKALAEAARAAGLQF
jgi:large subunit ribosomal protein L18